MATGKLGDGGGKRVARRMVLKTLATSSALFDVACGAGAETEAPAVSHQHAIAQVHSEPSPIALENALPGSSDFALKKPAMNGEVEAYASAISALAGQSLDLFVSVKRAQNVRWDLYRVGYYQGLGARLVGSGESTGATTQPAPKIDRNTGLLECHWDRTFTVVADAAWITGYYYFKITSDDGYDTYVPLIIRESGHRAPLLVQASVTTWQAYNVWGGLSLYHNQLPSGAAFQKERAFQVSFNRPFDPKADIGSVEQCMVRWLEQSGYDVSYTTNLEFSTDPDLLSERVLFMTVGHDEYWTVTERDVLQDARDRGLSIAFFSGNTGYRRIRLEADSGGAPRRTVTCYKSPNLDPHRDAADTTSNFSDRPLPRPENELIGLAWQGWTNADGYPFVVSGADHWIYAGTGVSEGATLSNIVGYEWDVVANNGLTPANLEVIGNSPVLHEYGYTTRSQAAVYYPTSSSFVMAAGTISWARALYQTGYEDARVQRMTANVLKRAGLFSHPQSIASKSAGGTRAVIAATQSSVVFAGSGVAGHVDGPAAKARFKTPGGIAAGKNGELYVCDTGNNLVRRISADGVVSTIKTPRLDTPNGIAVGADGTVYVCDTNHCRILSVAPDGKVSVFAGTGGGGLTDNANPLLARFNKPRGLAIGKSGALYVADIRNDAIRRVDAHGVSTIASGMGGPTGIAVGDDETVYYTATWSGSVGRITPDGTNTVLVNHSGVGGDQGGPGASAALRPADGLVVIGNQLILADTGNHRVRSVGLDGDFLVSGVLGDGNVGDGDGSDTRLSLPRGLCAFSTGIALADSMNHRILWFTSSG